MRYERSLFIVGLVLAACTPFTPPPSGPRVAATAENADVYGRPVEPKARACFDQCMQDYDNLDFVVGGRTYRTDERQKAACWDRCAQRVQPKVCDVGQTVSCSCPDPDDFSAPPIPGTRTCSEDRTAFGECECGSGGESPEPSTPASADEAEPEPEGEASSDPQGFEETCKAAIEVYCVEVCAEKPVAERGECEVKCLREPIESYDGRLKECSPDLAR